MVQVEAPTVATNDKNLNSEIETGCRKAVGVQANATNDKNLNSEIETGTESMKVMPRMDTYQ